MVKLKDRNITLIFDETNAQIVSLTDEKNEYAAAKMPIFQVAFLDREGNQIRLDADAFTLKSNEITEKSFKSVYIGENGIEITIGAVLDVDVKWQLQAKISNDYVLEWIQYPQIAVPDDLADNGGYGKILWGFNEGCLIENLAEREKCANYLEPAYPTVSMAGMYPAVIETQFMAYYNQKGGLYFGAHDKEDYLKGIDFYRYNEGIKLQFRHFCGVDFGENYTMNYPMVMSFFTGDWFDAAEIYRSWFKKEKTENFELITENKNLPEWYASSPVIVTYPVQGCFDTDAMEPNKLFPYINAMPHIERLEKELNSRIMVILMHWEGTAPWAPPYVWPPLGGEEELKKFINALHERNDIIGVYCSGLGWTEQSNLIESYNKKEEFDQKNLREVMCLSPKQELPYCNICTPQRRGYDMCPSHPFVLDTLKKEVDNMLSSGLDYIQLMDQNHGGNSHFCYSKSHNHPPVPGKWQIDAMRKLYNELFKDAGKVLFGCESAASEAYIPNLLFSDNRFELSFWHGKPVPVYAYLFHEYLNNFMGNQVANLLDNTKSPENIFARIAYSFNAGDMLTIVLNPDGNILHGWGTTAKEGLPDQKEVKDFVRTLNTWRRGKFKKYLHTGKMVKPYENSCDKFLCHTKKGTFKEIDNVFTSAWTDGINKGQFLTNHRNTQNNCEILLPEGTYRLYTNEDEFTLIQGGKQNITIPPLQAVLIESTN